MIRIGTLCIIDSESDATESTVPSGTVVYLSDGSRSWVLDDAWLESETFAETAKTKRLPDEIGTVHYIQFDETNCELPLSAQLCWNDDDKTINLGLPGDAVLQVGQEFLLRAKNDDVVEIPNGSAVYISGSTGNFANVKIADTASASTAYVAGVATQSMDVNGFGYITLLGNIRKLDTSGMSYGAPLWLNSNGTWSDVQPEAPNMSVFIGYVIREHATEGIIAINPTVIPRLKELSDINGTELTKTGQFPMWNDTNGFFDFNRNFDIETKSVSFKAHREAQATLTASTFTDIEFDLKIDEESNGITFLNEGEVGEDRSIVVVDGMNDIIGIAGCVHTNWTGSAGASVIVASRVLYSTDEGTTWTEARCLQTLDKNTRGLNAEGTFPYAGSIRVYNTTWVKLQVYVSDADMLLEGDTLFDNPVAVTIHMNNNGDNQEIV